MVRDGDHLDEAPPIAEAELEARRASEAPVLNRGAEHGATFADEPGAVTGGYDPARRGIRDPPR